MRLASALTLTSVLSARAQSGLLGLLSRQGIAVITPQDPDYANVTEACASVPGLSDLNSETVLTCTLLDNQRFSLKPLIVTFPANASQVADIVKIGSGFNHSIIARSGGVSDFLHSLADSEGIVMLSQLQHSYIANGLGGKDGSIVVDLRALVDINVDESSGVAQVGTGNRLGDVALALAAYNRGIPHGTCPYVGIGGHAGMLIGHPLKSRALTRVLAHGGFGFPSRMWGLTLDNIKSLELVLPNGTATKVSDNEQSDLFWVSMSFSFVKLFSIICFTRLCEERVAHLALRQQSNSIHTLSHLQA